MKHDILHAPSKLLITGQGGIGKSSYFLRYVLNADYERKFIFDHEGEFQQRLNCGASFRLAEIREVVKNGGWFVYDPSEEFPGAVREGFDAFCAAVFDAAGEFPGSKLFACDELQKLVGTNSITHPLACVMETSRRRTLDSVMIAQSANTIHNRIREQLTEVVTFKQLTDNAIDFLGQMGFQAEEIRGLGVGDYIAKNLRSGAEARGNVFK